MEMLRTFLEQQPMVALFLTVSLGYLLGEINIKGISMGIGAVLFVALAVGWFAPKSVPNAAIGTLGLALFLYAVGIHYGKDFFRGLASAEGRKANLLALTGVLMAGAVTLLLIGVGLKLGYALGLFAGSGTSTPTLQAAIQTLENDDPAVGYSVSYPFGVAGPILLLSLAMAFLKPKIEMATASGQELLEIAIHHSHVIGKKLAEVIQSLPTGVQIVTVRRDHRNQPAEPDIILAEGDVVLAVSSSRETLEQTRKQLGETAAGRITDDRSDLDYLRIFVSKPALAGKTLRDLSPPGEIQYVVMHVRRGDADLLWQPDLVLEYGDRVGLLTARKDFPAMRKFFGDSIKSTAEFSYISIGLGLALGFLVGVIQLPIPGIGKITIGLAGVLLAGLVLGRMRRTWGLSWTIPLSASLVLRNLGLTLFLAQVGMASGPKFAATVAETGFVFLAYGAVILIALVLPIILLGHYVFRLPFDMLIGVVAGACGNPAILAFGNKLTPTDRPDIAFAMIFPGMTIVKILFVDIVPAFFL